MVSDADSGDGGVSWQGRPVPEERGPEEDLSTLRSKVPSTDCWQTCRPVRGLLPASKNESISQHAWSFHLHTCRTLTGQTTRVL